ncbi:hypothetical protein AK812_SmicGene47734, partial [Symbiodinium microadriaticum]
LSQPVAAVQVRLADSDHRLRPHYRERRVSVSLGLRRKLRLSANLPIAVPFFGI